MANPYIGEIRIVPFNFAPVNWVECNGQLLPIDVPYDTLFNVIGTTYGGDGQFNFAVPDLRGRLPIGMGQGPALSNRQVGEFGGSEEITLATTQLPGHTHTMSIGTLAIAASSAVANRRNPSQAVHAKEAAGVTAVYTDAAPNVTMSPLALNGAPTLAQAGGGQPTGLRQPTLTLTFIICFAGIFPSQS